jgi:hypothetical protein
VTKPYLVFTRLIFTPRPPKKQRGGVTATAHFLGNCFASMVVGVSPAAD